MTQKKYTKPSEAELKDQLSPLQYKVTQCDGTEPPFENAYWDNKKPGIYVDVVSGEPLFSSLDKYGSGTGWPSFTKPLEPDNIVTREDRKLFMPRTEVRSKRGDSHLGHLFDDGPAPTGMRYCMNSASLRFIPVEKMEEEGYGEYLKLFESPRAKSVGAAAAAGSAAPAAEGDAMASQESTRATQAQHAVATLSGGCFWGVEELFRDLPGVIDTQVGYTGGRTENPTYREVCEGNTGHAEAIQIIYDPSRLSYEDILRYFFRLHDPTTLNRQGNDVGSQYRSAIFYQDEEQKRIAEKVKAEVEASGKWKRPIVTQIVPAAKFYEAEGYHQDYLRKNPGGYNCHYLRD